MCPPQMPAKSAVFLNSKVQQHIHTLYVAYEPCMFQYCVLIDLVTTTYSTLIFFNPSIAVHILEQFCKFYLCIASSVHMVAQLASEKGNPQVVPKIKIKIMCNDRKII